MSEFETASLQRFVDAQDQGGTYARALDELRAGRKATHWMWFVFPQIAGLGRSRTAELYAIASLGEAEAYLGHETLGPRLRECCRALADQPAHDAVEVFGQTDAMKLRSSMTLFARAGPGEPLFHQVLEQYFDGLSDPATEELF